MRTFVRRATVMCATAIAIAIAAPSSFGYASGSTSAFERQYPLTKIGRTSADGSAKITNALWVRAVQPALSVPYLCVVNPVVEDVVIKRDHHIGLFVSAFVEFGSSAVSGTTFLDLGVATTTQSRKPIEGTFCLPRPSYDGAKGYPRFLSLNSVESGGERNFLSYVFGTPIEVSTQVLIKSLPTGANVVIDSAASPIKTDVSLFLSQSDLSNILIETAEHRVQLSSCDRSTLDNGKLVFVCRLPISPSH